MDVLTEQLEYVRNLRQLEIYDSLAQYTSNEGYEVNKHLREDGRLRGDKEMDEKYQKIINDIDTAFLGVPPLWTSLTVYRSIDLLVTFSYKSEGFISTSIDVITGSANRPIKGFECCVIEITVAAGTKVLPLLEVSKYSYEKEVLLPRDGTLLFISETVKKVEGKDYIWIYAAYVPPNPKFKINNIREVSQSQLKSLTKIFTRKRILEIAKETKSYGDTFEDFKVSLRIEVATTASDMELLSGVSDTFINSIELEKYRKMFE